MKIRKSLQDILHMVRPCQIPVPDEYKDHAYFLSDAGNVILCIPEMLLEEALASGDPEMYEVGVPVAYVLRNPTYRVNDCIVIKVYYSSTTGLMLPDGYDDYTDNGIY